MKKIITLILATIIMFSSLAGSVDSVSAASYNSNKSHTAAAELCKSANTWEEFKEIFEEFQPERGDLLGHILKDLSEKIEDLSTFIGTLSYGGITDSEVNKFADAIWHATDLYSNSKTGHLSFLVEKRNLIGNVNAVNVFIKDVPLTHIGNVVLSHDVPYYSNVDKYMAGKDAYYYKGQIICYTCGVSYWNSDGTLAKIEYIPFDEVAQLKDEQKIKINRDFEGTILILLCTTDSLLGWTDLDGLYQYEDASGNMEFYNPDFIRYR